MCRPPIRNKFRQPISSVRSASRVNHRLTGHYYLILDGLATISRNFTSCFLNPNLRTAVLTSYLAFLCSPSLRKGIIIFLNQVKRSVDMSRRSTKRVLRVTVTFLRCITRRILCSCMRRRQLADKMEAKMIRRSSIDLCLLLLGFAFAASTSRRSADHDYSALRYMVILAVRLKIVAN
jgi:hypothetical protein